MSKQFKVFKTPYLEIAFFFAVLMLILTFALPSCNKKVNTKNGKEKSDIIKKVGVFN